MHRWLLLFYPHEYRRERAAELLEIVRDVRTARHPVRVAANLVGHGLRARLGWPASRTVVVMASVVATACGLFAASFGTWLAWLDSRPLRAQELAAVLGQLYPDQPALHVDQDGPRAVFLIYGGPLDWGNVRDLLFGDGGEYELASVEASLDHLPAHSRPEALAELRQRLRAAEWDVGEPVYSPAYGCLPDDPRCDPTSIPSDITVDARRGDIILEISIRTEQASPVMGFSMARATPWPVYPAGVAGFLVGAAGGWILFGWGSRRLERGCRAAQALAKGLFGFVMILWYAPILLIAPPTYLHYLRDPRFRWVPLWVWLGQPALLLPFLLGCAMAILMLGIAALPRPVRADQIVANG
ncbi:hypothetical protein [Dactylosporangium sp. CA-092794]|uniref:hypothetical protein n=1 Tax=Dactylosporangium sp. CA-092794 TaxID=3239929 RepID=UPI003D8CC625